MAIERTGGEQANVDKGRFRPGESGNPAGRPKGSRHKVTLAVESLLEGQAETLTQRAILTIPVRTTSHGENIP
jgi:hypothetical protein